MGEDTQDEADEADEARVAGLYAGAIGEIERCEREGALFVLVCREGNGWRNTCRSTTAFHHEALRAIEGDLEEVGEAVPVMKRKARPDLFGVFKSLAAVGGGLFAGIAVVFAAGRALESVIGALL